MTTATSSLRLTADPALTRMVDGRVLLGGSPYRVLRLSAPAAQLLDRWLDGEPVGDRPAHRRLAARLVRAGMLHPVHAAARLRPEDVTVVVPVRNHADDLARLLRSLEGLPLGGVVVVDDGSATPLPQALVRHPRSRGPAAARNSGWRRATTELVAFLDADVLPQPGWLEPLLRHFEDPDVAAVAPRVRSAPGTSVLRRYERDRSPLDLGPLPAPVRPGSRVSYVPSAALVVRTAELRAERGFDERMRFGEDVDLVWRLATTGGRQVRYEPAAEVWHTPRARWRAWARQRFDYGTSAAPLARRHGRAVAPVRMSCWTAASWAALAAGRTLTGLALAAGSAGMLPRKLAPIGIPADASLQLALRGHLGGGELLADAVTRSWWPVAVPLLARTGRGRVLLAAAYGRYVREWARQRPPVDLARWTAVRAADDLAYGAGVWWGALRDRSAAALLPDLSDLPGQAASMRVDRISDADPAAASGA